MIRSLFSNTSHTPQQEAEASASRAEKRVMGAGASVSDDDDEGKRSARIRGLQPQKETFFNSFQ